MNKLVPILLICGALLGIGLIGYDVGPAAYERVSGWVSGQQQVTQAVVVRESADVAKLPVETIKWLNSRKLRDDAKAAGISFVVIDPDVKDKDGKTPAELAPAIEAAKVKGLPALVLGTRAVELPKDEAGARKAMGL
jgi:hypothetical protein